jgi:hypothetical protein
VIVVGERSGETSTLWPQLEDLVPPELPPDVAVARLVALARSLLIENRQLREALAASSGAAREGCAVGGVGPEAA